MKSNPAPLRFWQWSSPLIVFIALAGNYYAHLLALVFTNVILASSLRLSLMCGQLNIGHSAFMSVGAYTSALLAKNLGVPFELALLGGAVLATVVGIVMGYPSLRLRGVYFAMVTVAFVEAIRLIVQIWVSLTRGMSGLSSIPQTESPGDGPDHEDGPVLSRARPHGGHLAHPLQAGVQPPGTHLEKHWHGR